MKYYYPEHTTGYERLKAEGKTAWAELHGDHGFENFSSRSFLLTALPYLTFETPQPAALELGCGTGPGACFLAERGFRVTGIDLIPTAIEIAREQAAQRGLDITYEVGDVVELPHDGPLFDLIVDSYCLQGIVLDADRAAVFAAVRTRLKPDGYYLVSTAYFTADHFSHETLVDAGVTYHAYLGGWLDLRTFIVYRPFGGSPDDYPEAAHIAGQWMLPVRRHRPPASLRAELKAAGFLVRWQDGGHLICVKAGAYDPW